MWSIVDYLKRPELVVTVQEWFGVEYTRQSNSRDDTNDEPGYQQQQTDNKYFQNNSTESRSFNKSVDKNGVIHRKRTCHVGSDQSTSSVAVLPNKVISGNGQLHHKHEGHNDCKELKYRITNKFWYYLFIIGTELGDELFYATMIPFWFWNIDGAVGRRVVFVWSSVMYIGQGLKDIIRWPRPGYPVQRLQSKWSIEYGMPSTHAMVCF